MENDDIRSKVTAATVGTPYVLNSHDVSEAPARVNRPIPVPSIYQDERGEIHNFDIGNKRINLLYSKRGIMRLGDLDKNIQHDFIFAGRVQVWTLQRDGSTRKQVFGPNEYVNVPPYVPHIFEFLEDTVMAEWWEEGVFHAWFYHPYRKLVEQSFQPTQRGRFAHYVVQDESQSSLLNAFPKGLITGIALGVAFGYILGRRR